jgi:UV DNA damage repair endonuclease
MVESASHLKIVGHEIRATWTTSGLLGFQHTLTIISEEASVRSSSRVMNQSIFR